MLEPLEQADLDQKVATATTAAFTPAITIRPLGSIFAALEGSS